MFSFMRLDREEDSRFLASFISVECPWISTTMEAVTWHVVQLVGSLLHMHKAPNLLPTTGQISCGGSHI